MTKVTVKKQASSLPVSNTLFIHAHEHPRSFFMFSCVIYFTCLLHAKVNVHAKICRVLSHFSLRLSPLVTLFLPKLKHGNLLGKQLNLKWIVVLFFQIKFANGEKVKNIF